MGKTPVGHIVFKATFEAVENMQQQFRRHIETLISEHRPLRDEEEKTLFYRELSHSTLGLGTQRDFHIYLDRIYQYGNVESIGRWLGQQTSKIVAIPADMGMPSSEETDISVFWSKFLDELFYIFPLALDKSISMSREGESQTGRQDSFYVGDKK